MAVEPITHQPGGSASLQMHRQMLLQQQAATGARGLVGHLGFGLGGSQIAQLQQQGLSGLPFQHREKTFIEELQTETDEWLEGIRIC